MGKKVCSVNPEIYLKETYIKHFLTIICNFTPADFPQSDDYNQFFNLFNYRKMGSLITHHGVKYSGKAAAMVGIQVKEQ